MNWEDTSAWSTWPVRYDLRSFPDHDYRTIFLVHDRCWYLYAGLTPRQKITAEQVERWLADPELLLMELTL